MRGLWRDAGVLHYVDHAGVLHYVDHARHFSCACDLTATCALLLCGGGLVRGAVEAKDAEVMNLQMALGTFNAVGAEEVQADPSSKANRFQTLIAEQVG